MPADVSPPENAVDCQALSSATLFGDVAVSLGLATAEQIALALTIQAERRSNSGGGGRVRVGDVLLERGVLDMRSVQKVLLEQKLRRERGGEEDSVTGRAGQFEILERLGRGGMGAVYKAIDRGSGRDTLVALKLLARRWLNDPEFLARFEREVKAAGVLSHPNIVRSLGSGYLCGAGILPAKRLQAGSLHHKSSRPYLVMEYVEGESLGRLLRRDGRLAEFRALSIARDVACALGHAHRLGIVHRDVKPDNVLLDAAAGGAAKLTDFGLAKLLQDSDALTRSGVAVGTPHYISPEQITCVRGIDHRADLYGLGAMLFHLLTGAPPFDAPTRNDILLMHVDCAPPDPRQRVAGISPGTAVIVLRLLSKQPRDRYDDAQALGGDLERMCTELQPATAPAVRAGERSLFSRVASFFLNG